MSQESPQPAHFHLQLRLLLFMLLLLSPSFAFRGVPHKVSLIPVVCLISMVKLLHGKSVNGSWHCHAKKSYLQKAGAVPLESVFDVLPVSTPVLDVFVWLDRQVTYQALLLV